MLAAGIGDYAITLAVITVLLGAYVLSRRMQPFWASRDGARFLTVGRELDHEGRPVGARRDLNAAVHGEVLAVKVRIGLRSRRGEYRVVERRPIDDSAWWYVLQATGEAAQFPTFAARVPAGSPLAERLDALIADADADADG